MAIPILILLTMIIAMYVKGSKLFMLGMNDDTFGGGGFLLSIFLWGGIAAIMLAWIGILILRSKHLI